MPLRFTSRDLLWLTAVAAVAIAWRVDRMHWRNNWNAAHEDILQQVNELQTKLSVSQAVIKAQEFQMQRPQW